MKKKKLSASSRRLLKLILSGILSTATLLFSITLCGYVVSATLDMIPLFLAITSALFMVHYLIVFLQTKKKTKLLFIRYLTLVFIYLCLTTISCFVGLGMIFYTIYSIIFSLSFVFVGVLRIIEKHNWRSVLLNALCILFGILLFFLLFDIFKDQTTIPIFSIVPLILTIICFGYSITMVFSGLRKATLIQIIKKTYAIEILYGLVILIIATSLMLLLIEPEEVFADIGDALWYCFAIVTTIGFGDVVAQTVLGRVLSVVLGIYGVVVVALITSIIVNFYNDTKGKEKDKEIVDEFEKIEQDNQDDNTTSE